MPEFLPVSPRERLQIRLFWAKHHVFAPGEQIFSEYVPMYALWLVLAGNLTVRVENHQWNVDAGQIFLGAPCRKRLISLPQGGTWLSVGLRIATAQGDDLLERDVPRVFEPETCAREQLQSLLLSLVAASGVEGLGGTLLREGLTLALAGWYVATWKPHEPGWFIDHTSQPSWLYEVLRTIEAHPAVSVEALAASVHFSTAQFRRVFARHLGMSPRDYLCRRRLELARLRLEVGDEPLAVVAGKTGWGSSAHFSHAFKAYFGVAPLEWRRAARSVL